MLGNSKNLFAIGVFRDFQHRYTYVLIKIKVMLITESNRLVIDTPIDYIKKKLYTKTFGFIDYDCPNPWSSKKGT